MTCQKIMMTRFAAHGAGVIMKVEKDNIKKNHMTRFWRVIVFILLNRGEKGAHRFCGMI